LILATTKREDHDLSV